MNQFTLMGLAILLAVTASPTSLAHNKVVVISLEDDAAAPQFRIVPTGVTTEANRGRLEYTADKKPTPQSIWGTVCDGCFSGDSDCNATPIPSTNAASNAVCQDMGYAAGVLDDNYGNTTTLRPSLGKVVCQDGATGLSDCTFFSHSGFCQSSDFVGVHCFTTLP